MGFISEFLVVRGTWPILTAYTAISMLGLLFTGAYILKGIKKVLHGPLNEHWAHGEHHKLTEINTREILVMAPLMAIDLVDRHLSRMDSGRDQQSCGNAVLSRTESIRISLMSFRGPMSSPRTKHNNIHPSRRGIDYSDVTR